jgi:hypothetical protein
VSNVSLVPLPSEQVSATCSGCGAALVADQRYCLSCGKPCSPVRLAFLDALTPEPVTRAGQPPVWGGPGTIEMGPAGYLPVEAGRGTNAWLRRNSGLLGLFAVLLMCLLIGLLVGHWASQSKTAAQTSVIKVEGLSTLGGAAATTSSGAGVSSSPTKTAAKTAAPSEKQEAAEGEKETAAEKAPPPKAVVINKAKLNKLTKSTGKKHQEEINALGAAPIETG